MLKYVNSPLAARVTGFCVLVLINKILVGSLAPFPDVWSFSPTIGVAHATLKIILLSIVIFAILTWPKRALISAELFKPSTDQYNALLTLSNIAFLLLASVTRAQIARAADPNAILVAAYSVSIVSTLVTLILMIAPPRFWQDAWKHCSFELALAAALGAIGFSVGQLVMRNPREIVSEESWSHLSDATMLLSFWILRLIDSQAFVDPNTRVLGADDFSVQVFAPCSGYEGIILISVFLCAYLFIFRRSLKFPQAFILFPLGIATIWLLNGLRIALLVFIGANLSPKIALDGFHSQFGWISFLLVSISFMAFSQRMAFFRSAALPVSSPASGGSTRPRAADSNPALLYLAPFIASLAAHILTNMAAPHEQALYPLKVVAIAGVLYAFRNAYARLWSSPALIAVLLGGVAGVLWIATDPGAAAATPLQAWIAELSPLALVAWLAMRAIGTIVMVPVAEELAFRGFLYRSLISKRFEDVDFRAFGVVALLVSSALFGLMHDRWLAAFLAGILYALLMLRRGRISDAIAAHMTTNAVIFVWAVAAGQWSLL